ncbi:MAG: pyridoxal phosphate-dependent aminotransferase [Candidatus Calescibacterium sp.]|nr:pyridoxal phosphate-dependent aminotransferase [Candidatus Calescibacterium sp.]MCX7972746.1 pyridoxal phosphate-dependent aminotransferase [bacterium]MDW8195205.1 pyridoxal phosphate-dependent aminotransferase [Candidatus Calescibacterium sp.]
MLKIPHAIERLGTEGAFEVLTKVKDLESQGKKIIHLQIGEPDFDTPDNIKEATYRALKEGKTHYSHSLGIWELRSAIANYYQRHYGVSVDPNEVVVGVGGKSLILITILALVDKGDEVICPNPAYPAYESILSYVGANIKFLHLRESKGFSFDIDELKDLVSDKTKLVIVNNPQNPTGGIIPKEDLLELSNLSEKYGFYVFCDEIYDRIVYESKFDSYLEISNKERTIILNGFSKTYAMTGWRLGWAIVPKDLVPVYQKLAINVYSCPPTFLQYGAIEALNGPQDSVNLMVKEFKKRRDYVYNRVNQIDKLSMIMPKGAFYAFVNISRTNLTSKQFFEKLLFEYNVAVLSGTAFGKYGEGYIRISYATSIENLAEALDRIENMVKSLN